MIKLFRLSKNRLLCFITAVGAFSLLFLSYILYSHQDVVHKDMVTTRRSTTVDSSLGKRQNTITELPQLKFSCGVDGVVTIKSGGRLGNLMGEYATLWAITKMHRLQPVLQPRTYHTLTKYFNNITIPPLQSLPCKNLQWKSMNLRVYNSLSKSQRTKMALDGIYIDGYPTSVAQFHRYRDAIVREFVFKPELMEGARQKLLNLANGRKDLTFVGVHVRRTDYKNFLKERVGGELVTAAYFSRAMNECRRKFHNPLFVVVSDEMDWCQKNLDNLHRDIAYAGNSNIKNPAEDLVLLASCNHSIITYGNFGFWGAYLAGGETFLAANVSIVPTELMRSIETAKIKGWKSIPGF